MMRNIPRCCISALVITCFQLTKSRSTRNNCCYFLASYGTIQSVIQSYMILPVCGASLSDEDMLKSSILKHINFFMHAYICYTFVKINFLHNIFLNFSNKIFLKNEIYL